MTKKANYESALMKNLVILAAIFIVIAGIRAAEAVVVPFILSLFISICCSPLVRYAEKFRVPKLLSVSVLVFIFLYITFWLSGLLIHSAQSFYVRIPQYNQELMLDMIRYIDNLKSYGIAVSGKFIFENFEASSVMNFMKQFLSGIGRAMTSSFLVILMVIFMLFEATNMPARLKLLSKYTQDYDKHSEHFVVMVNKYLAIKTAISLATAVIVGLGLMVIGIDFPLLWATLAFFFNYIPNIGSFLAAIPAMLMGMVMFDVPGLVSVFALYATTNVVMGNFIEPRVMGKGVGLSTLAVFLSLLFWGWMFGGVGMLLSVPLTMVLKIALDASLPASPLVIMLSSIKDVKAKLNQPRD